MNSVNSVKKNNPVNPVNPVKNSLFAVEVIQIFAAHQAAFGGADSPFVAIGVMAGFADGVVGYDIENQIALAVVDEGMRLAWLEDEGVARRDGRLAVFVAHETFARNHMVKFPLRAVRMVGVSGFASGHARDFDIERMAFVEVGGIPLATERDGNLLACAAEFSFRRSPRIFFDFVGVYFFHK